MIRLEDLDPALVARVLAADAEAMKAIIRALDPIVPVRERSDMAEALFAKRVRFLATQLGWWSFHPHYSKFSERGWPDWTFVRRDRCVFAELKRDDRTITAHQARVITLLRRAGQEVYIWRPHTGYDAIAAVLNHE